MGDRADAPARVDGPSRRSSALEELRWRARARYQSRRVRAIVRARGLDPRPRRDPDFVVVGAQKSGSSSLFSYLVSHPGVTAPLTKEILYFSLNADLGQQWYRRHFPLTTEGDQLTGEATPGYMAHPYALDRIALALPDVKVLAILRDPVRRLVSHYRHNVRLGYESLSLPDALSAESERVQPDLEAMAHDPYHRPVALQRFSYLRRSLYSPQVEKIQRLFPDRHLVLRLEDVSQGADLRAACELLGLRHLPEMPFKEINVNRVVGTSAVDADDIGEYAERLVADGQRTCDLLGWSPWTADAR